MKKISNLGENLNRSEMKEVRGGLLAPEGFNTACECVGSVGAYVANYPNFWTAWLATTSSVASDCSSKKVRCTYNNGSVTSNWTVSTV
jgi:hypothetical protein